MSGRDRQFNQSDYLQCNNYYSSFVMRSKPVARRFAQGRIKDGLSSYMTSYCLRVFCVEVELQET